MSGKHSRLPYTNAERQKILQYIIEKEAYFSLRGVMFWKIMEKDKVIMRTWQSAKEHFRKYIICNLASFEISQAEMKKIREGFNCTSKTTTTKEVEAVCPPLANLDFSDEEIETPPNDAKSNKKTNESVPSSTSLKPDKFSQSTSQDSSIKVNNLLKSKRKRESSTSSSSVDIVSVHVQDPLEPRISTSKQFKKIKHTNKPSSELKEIENSNKKLLGTALKSTKSNNKANENLLIEKASKLPKKCGTQTNQFTKKCDRQYKPVVDIIKKNVPKLKGTLDNKNKENWLTKKDKTGENSSNLEVIEKCEKKILDRHQKTSESNETIDVMKNITNKDKKDKTPTNLEDIKKCLKQFLNKEKEKPSYLKVVNKCREKLLGKEENPSNLEVTKICEEKLLRNSKEENPTNLEVTEKCEERLLVGIEENPSNLVKVEKYEKQELDTESTSKSLGNEEVKMLSKKAKKTEQETRLIIQSQKLNLDSQLVLSAFKKFKGKKRKEKLQMKKAQSQEDTNSKLDDTSKVIEYTNKMLALSNCTERYLNNEISTKVYKNKHFKSLAFAEKFYNLVLSSSENLSNEDIFSDPLINELHGLLKKNEGSVEECLGKESRTNSVKPEASGTEQKKKNKRRRKNKNASNLKESQKNKELCDQKNVPENFNNTTLDSDETYINEEILIAHRNKNILSSLSTENNRKILTGESNLIETDQNNKLQNEENSNNKLNIDISKGVKDERKQSVNSEENNKSVALSVSKVENKAVDHVNDQNNELLSFEEPYNTELNENKDNNYKIKRVLDWINHLPSKI